MVGKNRIYLLSSTLFHFPLSHVGAKQFNCIGSEDAFSGTNEPNTKDQFKEIWGQIVQCQSHCATWSRQMRVTEGENQVHEKGRPVERADSAQLGIHP